LKPSIPFLVDSPSHHCGFNNVHTCHFNASLILLVYIPFLTVDGVGVTLLILFWSVRNIGAKRLRFCSGLAFTHCSSNGTSLLACKQRFLSPTMNLLLVMNYCWAANVDPRHEHWFPLWARFLYSLILLSRLCWHLSNVWVLLRVSLLK
jgi:hypothetical protein